MQWVSTFASGASSLGRARRLAGYPAESGPPSSQGNIRRELPSYTKGTSRREKVRKNLLGETYLLLGEWGLKERGGKNPWRMETFRIQVGCRQ